MSFSIAGLTRRVVALLVVGAALCGATPTALAQQITVADIAKVLQGLACHDAAWGPIPSYWRVGVPVHGQFTVDNDGTAHVWTDELRDHREPLDPPGKTRTVIDITRRWDGRLEMSDQFSQLAAYMDRPKPPFPKQAARWHQLMEGLSQPFEIVIARDCPPVSYPDSPLKQVMIQAVEKTVARELTKRGEHGPYPAKLEIVIADFNTYDHHTSVLIPSTDEVFDVRLEDGEGRAAPVSDADWERWLEDTYIDGFNDYYWGAETQGILAHPIWRTIEPMQN